MWLGEVEGQRCVLRREDPSVLAPAAIGQTAWIHAALDDLAATGQFPASVPVPGLAGASYAAIDGAVWQLTTYLPGSVVGWTERCPLESIGAFIAEFHSTAAGLPVREQRPTSWELVSLHELIALHDVSGVAAELYDLALELHEMLSRRGDQRGVVHGDATAHNVLEKRGQTVGLIDFNLAHLEPPIADVAFCAWRTARPDQDSNATDLDRLRRIVGGYATRASITPDDAELLVACLWGRGVQMDTKRLVRGAGYRTNQRVRWCRENQARLVDTVAHAMEDHTRG
jgi:Ser/Thr protein kinase RdoA (MazF antagonist)